MALIKCPDCGQDISDKATQCIHCGCPISPRANNDKISFPYPEPRKINNTDIDSSKFRPINGAGYIGGNEQKSPFAMKVYRCPTCGKILAANATFCPNCGRRDPHIARMLKILLPILGLIFLLLFLSSR